MLKNYLKVAFRSLLKNKAFYLINILGLSFGFTCFFFISLWVWDEISVDKFHENKENIYQVFAERSVTTDSHIVPYFPSSLAPMVKEQIPEVNTITRVFPAEVVLQKGDIQFSEIGVYADASILDIFSFPLKEGNEASIFDKPKSVVISAELADKYFPNKPALGEEIEIVQEEKNLYTVTGVLQRIPSNSSLQFDFIMFYEEFEESFRPWWKASNKASFSNFNVTAFIEAEPGIALNEVNNKLSALLKKYSTENDDELFLYSFTQTYLHSDFSNGRLPTGRIKYVRLMSVIAIIILLIGCINFVNLSAVLAGKRRLEAGLRKVLGASKNQIIFQFITETIIISFVSLILAITAVEVMLPLFSTLTNKSISLPFSSFYFLILISSLSIVIGLLAGAYPAIYFSSFELFNTENKITATGLSFIRKSLIVLQFTCSIVFIAFTIIVFQQVDYINNKELGINHKNIIGHQLYGIKGRTETYKNELLNISGIKSVVFTEQDPIGTSNKNNGVWWNGKPENTPIYFNVLQAGNDFTKTFEIELIEGKLFNANSDQKEVQFIVNEAAAKQIMSRDIIGLELIVWGNKGRIVGMVKDYHHHSLTHEIEPLIIVYKPTETWNAYIRFEGDNTSIIEKVKEVYSRYESDHPFSFTFLEDRFRNQHRSVIDAGKLSITSSVAAILISCLGLFGLSAFVMQGKLKEIGIRKIMGSGTLNLIFVFTGSFVRLVLIATIIAIPIAWYYSTEWLSGFAYHTQLGFKPFFLAGIIALTIAFITVIFNTFRASLANPVEILKEE